MLLQLFHYVGDTTGVLRMQGLAVGVLVLDHVLEIGQDHSGLTSLLATNVGVFMVLYGCFKAIIGSGTWHDM